MTEMTKADGRLTEADGKLTEKRRVVIIIVIVFDFLFFVAK